MILKWNFKGRNGEQGMYFGRIGWGPAVGTCEIVDENWGSIKSGGFLG